MNKSEDSTFFGGREPLARPTRWVYRGVWQVLAKLFRVPIQPPDLPRIEDEFYEAFKPSPFFLRYLKFFFWLAIIPIDSLALILWLAIYSAAPKLGIILLPIFFLIVFIPNMIAYIGIYLRFDTTWYVMNSRSMCLRRGIMEIHEMTITYENIQNINITENPLQRIMGISNIIVETAGGGGTQTYADHHKSKTKRAIIEGIENAKDLKILIQNQLRKTATSGLGDDDKSEEHTPGWTPEHISALREIRNAVSRLTSLQVNCNS